MTEKHQEQEVLEELDRLTLEYGNLAASVRRERNKANLVQLLDKLEDCNNKMETLRSYIM